MVSESFLEKAEQQEFLRQRSSSKIDKAVHMFRHEGSAGWQSKRLAQLTTTFDYVMEILRWDAEVVNVNGVAKLVNGRGSSLTTVVKINQATIDAKYHDDYKDVALAEEKIEKALAMKAPSPIVG